MYPGLAAIVIAITMWVTAPHALEAVAQGGVGSGSAAAAQNLAVESKLTQQGAQIGAQGTLLQQLTDRLENFERCAAMTPPHIWNGSACVSTATEVVETNPAPTITVPTCATGEMLTATNGQLTCVEAPTVPSGTLCGFRFGTNGNGGIDPGIPCAGITGMQIYSGSKPCPPGYSRYVKWGNMVAGTWQGSIASCVKD